MPTLRSAALAMMLTASPALAQSMLPYTPPPPADWSFLGDPVMGGVSTGQARTAGPPDAPWLRLTGTVSTANNGGFIQTRARLVTPLPDTARGVVLRVLGNGERYFVHLRTTGTLLPWQYYQAPFETTAEWRELRLPFSAFAPSGRLLRATPRPGSVTSLGLVAFGRDHVADLSAEWLGVY